MDKLQALKDFADRNFAKGVGVLTLAVFELPAHAVFTVPTEITDAQANVALVGAAVFAIAVGVRLYKWMRQAL